MEVGPCRECGGGSPELLEMNVLGVYALLQPRIMLLESIAVHGIVQVVREIRIEVEQGATNKRRLS